MLNIFSCEKPTSERVLPSVNSQFSQRQMASDGRSNGREVRGPVAFAARSTALPRSTHVLRLRPGADLLVELREYVGRAGLRGSAGRTQACAGRQLT